MRDSGGASDEIEPGTHAFVVKIWREEGDRARPGGSWRGHITHVASGRRCYVTGLGQLDRFIAQYLEAMQVRLPLRWRIRQWIDRMRES